MTGSTWPNLFKRDYYFSAYDLWCLADKGTPKYDAMREASRAANPWAFQARYGLWTVYFAAVLIFVAGLKNLYFKAHDRYRTAKPGSGASMFFQLTALNRYISYRKLPRILCETLGLPRSWGTFLVTSAIALFTLCICFIPHPWYRACAGFGSPPLATRADVIAVALVPFIFILSGKLNLISTITGISYDRINVYHQTAGLLCLVFSWVHAIPFYYAPARENNLHKANNDQYYISGIPPIICLTFMIGSSIPSFRKRFYEVFVHIHWILAVLFYVSLFYHVYPELGTQNYMIATIVFWFVQLAYRAFVKGYLMPKNFFKVHLADIKLHKGVKSSDDCLEMTIPVKASWSTMQHIFVRFVDPKGKITQSHPFSIASSPSAEKIKLLIKPKNGITKHLLSQVQETNTNVLQKKVLIDGPYGGLPRDMKTFDSVFLMASGTGITAILPALDSAVNMTTGSTTRVRFDWCIRSLESLDWIQQELEDIIIKAKARTDLQLDMNIYVSNYDPDVISDRNSTTEKNANKLFPLWDADSIKIHDYKLNITEAIKNEYVLGYRNMVAVSGSDSMTYEVGNCVARLQKAVFMESVVQEVYLHTEQFGW